MLKNLLNPEDIWIIEDLNTLGSTPIKVQIFPFLLSGTSPEVPSICFCLDQIV